MPYITFLIAILLKTVLRFLDGKACTKDKTNTNIIQNYVKLYSGPDVILPIRYSHLLNLIYVTFTYGLAMPIMFPICCFGLINMYICERLQFAFFYKRPPMIGNTLSNKGLQGL